MASTQTSSLELSLRRALKKGKTDHLAYTELIAVLNQSVEEFLSPAQFQYWDSAVEEFGEEFMPSFPPMSPLTDSYFILFILLDLEIDDVGTTVAGQFVKNLKALPESSTRDKAFQVDENLHRSRMGIYEQLACDGHSTVVLKELVSGKQVRCDSLTGYEGAPGQLWFVRLCPPLKKSGNYLTLSTPYILRGATAAQWEAALRQELEATSLEELFKVGSSTLSWHEYIFQAYCGHQTDAIFLTGLLGDPSGRPHSEGRDLSPASRDDLPIVGLRLNLALSHGKRKLLAQWFPQWSQEFEPERKGSRAVSLTVDAVRAIKEKALEGCSTLRGQQLRAARELNEVLDEALEEMPDFEDPELFEEPETDGDYLLRLDLMHTREEVCRFLRVPMSYSFLELHAAIQAAMQWDDMHLHEFLVDGIEADEDDILGDELVSRPEVIYRYDFGDDWQVQVSVLRDYDESQRFASLICGRGPSPPEDCGGVIGFQLLLEALRDPDAEDPREFRDWVDPDYDVEHFDFERVNRRLLPCTPGLAVKSFRMTTATVAGEWFNIVMAVELPSGFVAATEPDLEYPESLFKTVEAALEKRPQTQTLLVEDPRLALVLEEEFGMPVETRPLHELVEFRQSLELHLLGEEQPPGFEGISSKTVTEFTEAAYTFYLEAPWRFIDDDELFLVEGLTREPLYLSVLGGAGLHYGLGYFENSTAAAQLFAGKEGAGSTAFVTYFEGVDGAVARRDLEGLGVSTLADVVPYALSREGPVGESTYRLLTKLLGLVLTYKEPEPGRREFYLKDGGHKLSVTWPVSPSELLPAPKSESRRKLGRNDPCWCGSGKKYKKCHYGID